MVNLKDNFFTIKLYYYYYLLEIEKIENDLYDVFFLYLLLAVRTT